MRVPLSWLREMVAVDLDLDELIDVMSMHGLEVEEIRRPGAGAAGIITARVLDHAPHPHADTLQIVHVTHGDDEVEVVCGASNFSVGDVVAHAEVGARLPDGMELSARDIRGVTSHGMLCSARELEVGEDHSGIMVLRDDLELGVDVTEILGLGEPVIDIAVFADRGDHHSVLGIAREVAAILDLDLEVPDVPSAPSQQAVPVHIDAPEGCSQFVAWAVDEVRVGPSPWWLRHRLTQCGIRAINTVVDVTNYVMLELGEPLHAFDLETLRGPEIVVRWAAENEELVTLDGQRRTLEASDLVVADADRAVALAGVMGGAETEVSGSTTRVLVEGATWDPATVRATSRRLDVVSEASMRFARRVDPGVAPIAVARAVQLLEEVTGASPSGSTHAGTDTAERPAITLDTEECAEFLGVDVDAVTQAGYLERLGCEITADGPLLTVIPPSWRGDLGRSADLVEEIARLHGYETIPATLPTTVTTGGLTPAQRAVGEVHEVCRAAGFHEAYLRPFVGEAPLQGVVPSEGRVQLANPLAQDAAAMRPSVIEGLLGAIRHNVGQGQPGAALFEVGRIFRPSGDPLEEVLKRFGDAWRWTDPDGRSLPAQPRVLGLAAQGLRHGEGWLDPDETWDVQDLLAVVDGVVDRVPADRQRRLERDQDVAVDGLHPGRTAVLRLDGHEVGVVGQVHPSEADRRDLPEPVVVAELLLEPLLEEVVAGVEPTEAEALTRHPAVTVDVALVADEEVAYRRLEEAVRAGVGDLLDGLWLFDEYRGDQLGEGQRSVAIRLRLQAADRQLTDGDADRVIEAVALEAERVGATLRR